MKILLVNPPCGPRTIGMRNICRIEPLGLELIGAAVSDEHDVRLVDMLVRPSDLKSTLGRFTPDVVGVTTETARMEPALDVLRSIRKVVPECLTVVGGHHPTIYSSDFDDPAVDLIVLGEGVEGFSEICATKAAGVARFDHVAGLMIRTPGGLKATQPRPLPTTLDNQPFPDRSLTARYRKVVFRVIRKLGLWMPHRSWRPQKVRLLLGLLANGLALSLAHRHVPAVGAESEQAEDSHPLTLPFDTPPSGSAGKPPVDRPRRAG